MLEEFICLGNYFLRLSRDCFGEPVEVSANTNYVIRALLPGSGVFSPRKRAEGCRGVPAAWGAAGGAGGLRSGCPPSLQAGTGRVASVMNY